MNTATLELPTMRDARKMKEVAQILRRLSVRMTDAVKGKVKIDFGGSLRKVDVIIALEEAGYIVKY